MIVNVSIFVLEVCTSVWDECGVGWAVFGVWGVVVVGCFMQFFPKCCNCLQD